MSNTKQFNTDFPSMQCRRWGCAAAALRRNIFVLGGGGGQNSGEMFDFATKQWITLHEPMSTVRIHAAAVALGDDIVVMGGAAGFNVLSSAESYNTVTKQWSAFPPMKSRREGCAAGVVDGRLIVVGGRDESNNFLASVEEYNPTTQKWVTISPMHIRRSGCAVAELGGELYVMGGYNKDGGKFNNLSSVEVYDPTTKRWMLIADMSTARRSCAAASPGGKILVVGGYDGREWLSSCEEYDTTTQKWSRIASMNTKRRYCAAVEVEGNLYVMGGMDGSNNHSSMESLMLQPRTILQPRTSEFYTKLFEDDKRNVLFKMEDLMNIVHDVHEMKFFYTFINHSYRSGSVTQEDRKRYIAGSLKKVASSTTCYDSIAIFKQLLDKAREDAIISDHDYYTFDRMAEVTHTSAAPFVKEIWGSLQGITARVVALENRVDLLESRVKTLEEVSTNVVESLQMLQKGIKQKQRIEAITGMLGAVLNAVSFGFAGSVAQGVMGEVINSIVDFGDISHIQTVVKSFGDVTVEEAFRTALDTISDSGDNAVYRAAEKGSAKLREPTVQELMDAANEGNPLFAIVVTAKFVSREYDDAPQEKPIKEEEKKVSQTNIPMSGRLDALEEAAGIDEGSSGIRKRLEALEMSIFEELQEGPIKERVSKLEFELL